MSRTLVWTLAISLGVIVASFLYKNLHKLERLDPPRFWSHVRGGDVRGTLVIGDDAIDGELAGSDAKGKRRLFRVAYEWKSDTGFIERLEEALAEGAARGGTPTYRFEATSPLGKALPYLGVAGLVLVALAFVIRSLKGGSGPITLGKLGASRHRTVSRGKVQARFLHLAGFDEAKESLAGVVAFLREPGRFRQIGATLPHGVLLVGEPGSGKTLLGQAVAGEAGVSLLYVSSCDFVEMFVGVGAARMHGLFKQARAAAPCVVFLDDVDDFARRMSRDASSRHVDERLQTLLALAAEMDTLRPEDAVVVIAAARADSLLDETLTRGGRFEKRILLPPTTEAQRLQVLQQRAATVACAADVDLASVAARSGGLNPAELRALVNQAAMAAAAAGRQAVMQPDVESALAQALAAAQQQLATSEAAGSAEE